MVFLRVHVPCDKCSKKVRLLNILKSLALVDESHLVAKVASSRHLPGHIPYFLRSSMRIAHTLTWVTKLNEISRPHQLESHDLASSGPGRCFWGDIRLPSCTLPNPQLISPHVLSCPSTGSTSALTLPSSGEDTAEERSDKFSVVKGLLCVTYWRPSLK